MRMMPDVQARLHDTHPDLTLSYRRVQTNVTVMSVQI